MKIAIVGCGLAGMSAAYDLVNAGHQVDIFESTDYPGGLAGGFKEPEWTWSLEKFYHHWFLSDSQMLGLIEELGLKDHLVIRQPKTVMYHKGQFYPFDSIPAAILYPGLGWGINKIRFGLATLYIRLTRNWKPMEHVTVDTWMRKWAGETAYNQMWLPMLDGKFGEHYARQVNMAWMWARLHSRTTKLATFEGGFQAFADAFAAELQKRGVTIHYKTGVDQIHQNDDGKITVATKGSEQNFDRCLVTVSPALMAHMAPDLPSDYLQGLLNLKSLGAVVMVLAIKHRLSDKGYYWFNLPKAAGFPFLALVEHTNFLPKEYYGGDHLLYCGDYLETDHEYFKLTQEELLERFLPALQRINPEFKPDWVRKTWLFKTNYAQPVPLVDHSRNIPDIRTPMAGLYFASMSQVYPWDRGTNFAVEIGRKAARMILTDSQK
ncbi:NAD(P)/FAD-dependent oxidoreductase [Leptolinea tardivitalis]|uniref:Oxidoreductase n=1 Tax=Leptolinea tardivitalis TaxID=229920 RepID=A0A0P6WV85_9CHLR|nr:NAD(P)/FAD-dependent oxidoreductase [Leptolinea tardivitalis]KPL70504.1 oxidoreductase [Leptolinea tardivitalis]GAP22100.1 protoporphyrinogen oxidase [Leptolinea tardivitalis]